MQYVIWGILILIVIIIVGLILRKRTYDKVDALESWKIDIMNRNIASELAKIKTLNLTGETEEKFKLWKNRWEKMVNNDLSEVEDFLFDAEEAADQYRFPKAKKSLTKIEDKLNDIEVDLEAILTELNELLDAEKESRKRVESLKPDVELLRMELKDEPEKFGKSSIGFLKSLDDLDKDIDTYYEYVEAGNYSEASELVSGVETELATFKDVLADFPELLDACEVDVPEALDRLLQGVQQMHKDGYHIQLKSYESEIRTAKLRLRECVKNLSVDTMEHTEEIIDETKERIDEIYNELEQEAHAKNYLDSNFVEYKKALHVLSTSLKQAEAEIDELKKTYYLDDQQLKSFTELKKSIDKLSKHRETLEDQIKDKQVPHTTLQSQVERSFEQMQSLGEQLTGFTEETFNLRKDELEAKKVLDQMQNDLGEIQRQLKLSNLPGVPTFIWSMIEKALEKNERVIVVLEKQPLDMGNVQQALDEAKRTIEQVAEQTELIIDQAFLTERVIQYANRYRSRHPILAAQLSESERLFRDYEYELALEKAARAIEEIEPGALKKIEMIYNEQVMQ